MDHVTPVRANNTTEQTAVIVWRSYRCCYHVIGKCVSQIIVVYKHVSMRRFTNREVNEEASGLGCILSIDNQQISSAKTNKIKSKNTVVNVHKAVTLTMYEFTLMADDNKKQTSDLSFVCVYCINM